MRIKDIIEQKLTAAFSPICLRVLDQSHLHAGHAGAREGGESHFLVEMKSAAFNNTRPLARHRMVNAVLKAELAGPIHALTLSLSGVENVQPEEEKP